MSKESKANKFAADAALGTVVIIVPDVGPSVEGALTDQDDDQITLRTRDKETNQMYDVIIGQKHIVQLWIAVADHGAC
jgi:hypothetical protein